MEQPAISVDADFPGGNIVLEKITGDEVYLRPDLRTTTQWWFYWHFRIRNVAGRGVRFVFDRPDAIGADGPYYSSDGERWTALGRACVQDSAFTFAFPPEVNEAFFAVAIPYLERHLREFLSRHPQIEVSSIGSSEHGRAIELLSLLSQQGTYQVPLTARTHACESIANYTLEGLMDAWLTLDGPDGEFLREHVDFRVVPFVDKDGVEEGDQGKARAPHDHNRDSVERLYASTQAFQAALRGWRGTIPLALDLHCPWIAGGRNEQIFLVGSPQPWTAEETAFCQILQQCQRGELRYDAAHTIAAGEEWNNGDAPTLSWHVRNNYPVKFACTTEIPYAIAGGQKMSETAARGLGRDLARAISLFVQQRCG